MKKHFLFLFLFFFSSQVFATEYIIELKNIKGLNELQTRGHRVKRTFNSFGVSYGIVEVTTESFNSFKSLSTSQNIGIIEPNIEYRIIGLENKSEDPQFGELWGLNNTGAEGGVVGADINVLNAWKISKGSKDITIAVIDTGIDYNHEDLKDNIWVNEKEQNGVAGVDDDGNGFIDDIHGYDFTRNSGNSMDDNGHGTHCAGTIGAVHNSIGVAGVMKDVRLMGLKFLTSSGGGSLENAIKAIDYATQMGVDIMSNSWGGGGYSKLLEKAIQNASDAGIVFIAAAGNARNDNDRRAAYPASYDIDNVISVAAHDRKDSASSFTSYGQTTVDIFAPGTDILSTIIGDKYKKYSGTSMATPHVSGIVGLFLAKNGKTQPKDIRELMVSTAVKSPAYIGKVASDGRINAFDFISKKKPADPGEWKSVAGVSWESDHPISYWDQDEFSIKVDGAKQIRAVFGRIDMGSTSNSIKVLDPETKKIAQYITGKHNEFTTKTFGGDTMMMTYTTWFPFNRYGFKLKAIQYKD
jgi:subtilisin family serine protease